MPSAAELRLSKLLFMMIGHNSCMQNLETLHLRRTAHLTRLLTPLANECRVSCTQNLETLHLRRTRVKQAAADRLLPLLPHCTSLAC